MQKFIGVLHISILTALILTGCAREGMRSYVAHNDDVISTDNQTLDIPNNPIDLNNPPTEEPTHPAEPPVITEPTEPTQPPVEPIKPPVVVKPPTNPTQPTEPTKPPTIDVTDIEGYIFTPLIWEKTVKQAKEWSKMVYSVILKEEKSLLSVNSAEDVEIFCPRYKSLSLPQRLNFWGQFIAALALPESSWHPTSQMTEPGMSEDPITKVQVKSEGLLQLSYQDEKNYRLDCGFDWEKDRYLAEKDPRRTILDPYLNLRCGIKILSIQLKKYKKIVLKKNVYWSVISETGKYSKVKSISANTKQLKFCN